VRDGNTITGGGVTAGIDFALTVLTEVCGAETARAVQHHDFRSASVSQSINVPPKPVATFHAELLVTTVNRSDTWRHFYGAKCRPWCP
jgi:transcriptional regulator GlxA family with amidase domain